MRTEVLSYEESVIEAFAVTLLDRQLERFFDQFGRVPKRCDPVFFDVVDDGPSPMSAPEVLALVTGEAWANEQLELESMESARIFAILVLMRYGLPESGAEDAICGTGRFAIH